MKDFLQGCMDSVRKHSGDVPLASFQGAFCSYCRNKECTHAKWGGDRFSARVNIQEERLLNPLRLAPEEYGRRVEDFKDMFETALQLELAAKKGDWSLPEEIRTTAAPQLGNTPNCGAGIVIDDGPPPISPPAQRAHVPVVDPWAIGQSQVVAPGATIKLKGKPDAGDMDKN